ncbi:MAG TPA: 2,3-bisphosphoglycerate-independent phosphoglycerate mutase [Nitriliruptoraceae bacterium]|nr:2,3-bisphosphoglycerate-independent phosphoglycerate mutase [Nitriliruptoraceae bacterium]
MFKLSEALNDNPCKIVLLVLDGLGGYADNQYDSELEQAATPNLDRLAAEGSVGLLDPLMPGITVGSGPGHLALFGYDPEEHELGRGVLSATGVEFDLRPGDVAARGNLATLDAHGNVTDRRAGRIADEPAGELTDMLNEQVEVAGVEVFFQHISQHRILCVLRGEGLDARIEDIDPQRLGVPPKTPTARHPDAEATATVLANVDERIRAVLADDDRADVLLLRGFDTFRELPDFADRYRLRAATVAAYPMYRGVAKLVGMEVLPRPHGLDEQITLMREHWDDHDYFFMHHKATDQAGHDGLRDEKVAAIEEVDAVMDDIVALEPDVLIVTGDHSSPTQLSGHSWHPVPVLMWGPHVGTDAVTTFAERTATTGLLGRMPTQQMMTVALAAAGKLEKWGA